MNSGLRKQVVEKLKEEKEENFDISALLSASQFTVKRIRSSSTSFYVSFSLTSKGSKIVGCLKDKYKFLERRSVCLIGKLTHINITQQRGKNDDILGNISLEDETGSLFCVCKVTVKATGPLVYMDANVLNFSESVKPNRISDFHIFEALGGLVFLADWNYVVQRGYDGYIEVNKLVSLKPSALTQSPTATSQPAKAVISVRDAAIALKHRDELKPGVLSVVGRVSVVSEVFRMKSDHMFLMKMEDGHDGEEINILVKRPDHLIWQNFITPKQEYVLTNLRATTVQKGTVSPIRVFVTWDGATFCPRSHWNGKLVSLEDWLGVEKLPHFDTVSDRDIENKAQKLFTYEGTVTDVSRSDAGIYELDNKIGLYLSFVPAVHKLRPLLRPGCLVLIYNTHHRGSPQPPKTRLVGCALCCVKVSQFSPFDIVCQSDSEDQCASLHLINQYSLNLSQFDQLLAAEKSLKEKLGSIWSPKLTICCLLSPARVGPTQESWGKGRPPLDVFLTNQHHCQPSQTNQGPAVPTGIQIKEIQSRMTSLSDILGVMEERYAHLQLTVSQLKEQLYWNPVYKEVISQESGEVLVGVLRASEKTGQIQLVDNTGAIDVVLTGRPDNQRDHDCSQHQCVGHINHVTGCETCPYMQSTHHNSVIRVDRYLAVTEVFLATSFPTPRHIGDPQYVLRSRIHPYLVFSMEDVVMLIKRASSVQNAVPSTYTSTNNAYIKEKNPCSNSCTNNQTYERHGNDVSKNCPHDVDSKMNMHCSKRLAQKRPTDTENQTTNDNVSTQKVFFLSHKESLTVENRGNASASLRFCALGCFLNQSSEDNEILFKKTKYMGASCPKPSTSSDSDISVGEFQRKNVLLVFQESCVKNYHLLNPGHFYKISVSPCHAESLLPKCVSLNVKLAVEKFKARECVVLPAGVQIHRLNVKLLGVSKPNSLVLDQPETLHITEDLKFQLLSNGPEKICTVQEILSESYRGTSLVSVTGEITSRSHTDPETQSSQHGALPGDHTQDINAQLGVSTLDNKTITLALRDAGRSDTQSLNVYLNLQRSSFPLGLLPGAVVEFSQIERKVSRKNTVYCHYLVVSTVRVIQMGPSTTGGSKSSEDFEQTNNIPNDLKQLKLCYLGNLWLSEQHTVQSFFSVCHVLQVLRLSIKSACNQCNRPIMWSRCSSAGCGNIGHHLVSRASILIEDGSSTAIVLCRGETIRELLGLTPSQWYAVENRVTQAGEVFIQQVGPQDPNPHPLGSFFTSLCDSNVVKREWKMYLTTRPVQPTASTTGSGLHHMAFQEFPLKTVNTGSESVETHCLPFLQLLCMAIEPVDPTAMVLQHLENAGPT